MSSRPPPTEFAAESSTRARLGSIHPRILMFDAVFGSIPPFVANRIRTQALRVAGVRIGVATIFWGKPKLVGTGRIEKKLTIGTYCGFNEGCFFDLEAPITIGNHVAVGHDVLFSTRGAHAGSSAQRAGHLRSAPIVIGDGAWLGSRVTVMPGVTIGASSVIGAGLVVTKDIPENTLWTGGPPISLARWR